MTAGGPADPYRAFVRFREALLDFSDEPSLENVVRYLTASRALDEARARPPSRARKRDLASASSA